MAQMVKNLPAMQETQVWSLDQEDALEKRMASHITILVQIFPWTELVGYSSWGCKESEMTEQLTLQCFSSLSMRKISEGYGNIWRQPKWEERLFEVCYRKQANYHYLYLENSKTGKGVGKVYGGKKKKKNKLQICFYWRFLAWKSGRQAK